MSNNGPVNRVDSSNSLSYLNSNQSRNVLWKPATRDPTVNDRRYKLGTIWTNTTTNNSWQLTSVVTNSANWEPLSQSAEGNAPITEFVVSPDGRGDFFTIQAAVTALGTAAGSIYIRPTVGGYGESVVFPTAFIGCLVGAVGNSDQENANYVSLQGVHTPPTTGSLVCRNIRFSSSTNAFLSAVAGVAPLTVDNCQFVFTSGDVFDVANWIGPLTIKGCTDNSTLNSLVDNNAGSSTITITDSNGGVGSTAMNTQGNVNIFRSVIGCAINPQTGSIIDWSHSKFTQQIVLSNDSTGDIDHCVHRVTGSSAITQNSSGAISLSNLTVDSNNAPPIDGGGAGVLSVSSINFQNTLGFAGGLTLANHNITTGTVTARGSVSLSQAATQLQMESGAVTDFIGNAVLVAGTVTVANTNIAANDQIMLTVSTPGGTQGILSYTIIAATSFTITSDNAADTSTVEYRITRKL